MTHVNLLALIGKKGEEEEGWPSNYYFILKLSWPPMCPQFPFILITSAPDRKGVKSYFYTPRADFALFDWSQ